MRLIGHLPSETSAATFSDFLYVQGITNSVESEKEGWAVWIHSEDELAKARDLLRVYVGNPQDPQFHRQARQARELKQQEVQEEVAAEQRVFGREQVFRSVLPFAAGPLTLVLIAASTLVTVVYSFGWNKELIQALFISPAEILKGQVWRLITPIFLHQSLLKDLGFLHLLFNMLWLFDLGSMIEARQSTRRLAVLVVVIAALSNLGQYYVSGPSFGGMSGVVYGLLGYIWMKGKFDPASGLFLHQQTVTMMLIWFFACLFHLIPNVANTAHAVGLGVGMAWGFLSSFRPDPDNSVGPF